MNFLEKIFLPFFREAWFNTKTYNVEMMLDDTEAHFGYVEK